MKKQEAKGKKGKKAKKGGAAGDSEAAGAAAQAAAPSQAKRPQPAEEGVEDLDGNVDYADSDDGGRQASAASVSPVPKKAKVVKF